MIEKIPFETETITHDGKIMEVQTHASPYDLQVKINELVDAINTIQKEREAERFEIQEWIGIIEAMRESVNIHEKQIDELQMKVEPETPDDPYEEPRKWIGKMCWFWDEDRKDAICDVLGDVVEDSEYPYLNGDCYGGYKCCEPVKPDDDIIYKGE